MSTNFYIRETSQVVGGPDVTEYSHIGKRSGGWTFMFQGSETPSVEQWRQRTAAMAGNMEIVNEYETSYTHEEFWQIVQDTTKPWGPKGIQPHTARRGGDIWIDANFAFMAGEFV